MSYEGHHEDRAKVLGALGGTRGLLDSGLPSIVFLSVHHRKYCGVADLGFTARSSAR